MLYLSRFYVCVLLKAGPLNCTFPQTQMAWAHCISLTLLTLRQQEASGTFQEVQSLKKNVLKKVLKFKKKKNINKKTGKGYLSGLAVLQHTSKNHYCLFL